MRQFLALAICTFLSRGAAAQEAPGTAPPPDAEKVEGSAEKAPASAVSDEQNDYLTVTSARRPEKTAFNTATGTNIIDEERLEELQPRSVPEALRAQPGIWIQRTGHLGGAPIIRGFMGNRVVYLFDGVRRNTAGLFGGPNSFLGNVDPQAVRKIEVIRGPGSVLYGSDAIGGVVNVITSTPLRFAQEGMRNTGRASYWYETVDDGSTAGFRAGLVSPKLILNLGGGWQDFSGVRGGAGQGKLRPTAYNQRGVNLQAAVRASDKDKVELLVQHFERPRGRRYDRPDRIQRNDRQMVVLRYYGKNRGPFDSLKLEAYYHRQFRFTNKRSSDSRGLDRTYGAELQARSRFGDIGLTYGLHYNRDIVESSDPQNNTFDPTVIWDNPAAFVLGEWRASDRLTLEASVRGDYFLLNSTAPANSNSIPLGLSPADLNISRTNSALTGGVGAIFQLAEHLNWVASAGTAFRAPNKNDFLGVGEFSFGYKVPPGNGLKPERSLSVETGLRANFRNYSGALNVFYTTLTDVIRSRPSTFKGSRYVDSDNDGRTGAAEDNDGDSQVAADEEVYANSNVNRATAYGVELAARIYLLEQFATYGNLTAMMGDQSDNEPLDRGIPLNGTLGFRWQDQRIRKKYWAEFEAQMVAPFSRIPSNRARKDPAFRVEPQDRNSESLLKDGTLPGYLLVNARAGARIADSISVVVQLENLTDQRYRVKDSRIDGPGFNARLGLNVNF